MYKVNKIYLKLKQDIIEHKYTEHEYLPCEKELCIQFNCARNTLRKAIYKLELDGYVRVVSGHGILCLGTSYLNFSSSKHISFKEEASIKNLTSTTKMLEKSVKSISTKDSLVTKYPVKTQVTKIIRVRLIDNKPAIIDINYFNNKYIPKLSKQVIENSIYEFLEDTAISISHVDKKIVYEKANQSDCDIFGIDLTGLIVVHNYVYDHQNNLIEYTQSRHLPDQFNFMSRCTR